jgi:hypothetical protein
MFVFHFNTGMYTEVFGSRDLRKIYGCRREEIARCQRNLHSKGLHGFYSLPNIIRMIKARRLRWAGHVARMGMNKNAYRFFCEKT